MNKRRASVVTTKVWFGFLPGFCLVGVFVCLFLERVVVSGEKLPCFFI